MELRKVNQMDVYKIRNAVRRKNLLYCTPYQIAEDFTKQRLYGVYEGNKILATVSLVEEPEYGYTAVKRLCILNKKNQGKGIARFALHEIQKAVKGRIGGTPWIDNAPVRHLFETEGFTLQYIFNERWCFYAKDCN